MVAQQILSILSALAAGSTRFVFEGREINLVWSCGIFITMNPGKYVCTLLLRGNSTDVYDNVNNSLLPWGQVLHKMCLGFLGGISIQKRDQIEFRTIQRRIHMRALM